MFSHEYGGFVSPQARVGEIVGALNRMQTDAFNIVLALGEYGLGSYSERELSTTSGVPRTTLRRYIHTPHTETVNLNQLLHLRSRIEHHEGTRAWTSRFVGSYYAQVLASAKPHGDYWSANTTLFSLLESVGESFDYSITLNKISGLPMAEPRRVDAYARDYASLPVEGYL